MNKRILVIDDEVNIRNTINEVLGGQQFEVVLCENPLEIPKYLGESNFDLVILDIWMPEKDGHQILDEIRADYPSLPVLVISGHINISSSVELGKKGASDFLEKPFTSDFLLFKVHQLLKQTSESTQARVDRNSQIFQEINRKQRTILKNVLLTGKGIHKGENNGIILAPLPENSGIVFQNITNNQSLEAKIENVAEANFYSTTLNKDGFELTVVEHLLSALHIYGIDNINIKVSGEIPIFDGSASKFCHLIEEAGIKEQDALKKQLFVDKEYRFIDEKNSDVWCTLEPYDGFMVDYTLKFPPAFGDQSYQVDLSDPESRIDFYKQEIAGCRTFGFLEEIKHLQSYGLGKGISFDSGLLVDQDRVINTELLFENEFARHKVLDIIGDLYLFGCEVRGKIVGHFSGHRHNINLQKMVLGLE